MARTEWADFFDDHAPRYDENCFTKGTIPEVDFLEKELALSPGATILDVGCGTGRHSVELARRGYAVTGLDASAGMLEVARRRAAAAGVEVTWIQGDATEYSFSTKHDAAICLCEGSFGLLGSRDDAIRQPLSILRNIAGALHPRAKCLLTVLNGFALIRRHSQAAVEARRFDPSTLAEVSEVTGAAVPGISGRHLLRERAFVPTELVLLFTLAGLDVLAIWGGTAGNWGKRPVDLGEIEIMVLAERPGEPGPSPVERLLARR
jgi:SAM-dependent methyltransferase